jgi:hypothetical protein
MRAFQIWPSFSRYTALLIKAALEGLIESAGVPESASDHGEVAIGRQAPERRGETRKLGTGC